MKKSYIFSALFLIACLCVFLSCGDDSSSSAPCYTLTTSASGLGTVEVTPIAECYNQGAQVQLTAIPASGYGLNNWSGNYIFPGDEDEDSDVIIVFGTSNISLTANFVEVYTLDVNVDPLSSGIVNVEPDLDYYMDGETVTLEATPATLNGFSHWLNGSNPSILNPIELTFDSQDEEITALFGRLENEPDCGDNYVDNYNGGCNSTPYVFQDIVDGQIYLGTSGTFVFGSETYRDTDWFRYVASQNVALTFRGVAEFAFLLFIIDGTDGCDSTYTYTILDDNSGNAGDTVTVTAIVSAGTYWMWAGPSVFEGYPCPADYKVWFAAVPIVQGAFSEPRPVTSEALSSRQLR
ncbi:MAG: hypothetical protein V3S06_04055 [candidate division Zixibacteria bacterium]